MGENMKLVMVDMKKAIAKCSHEDAPELSLPPYRSAYRFTNTMINKGDDYEHINDMASMFAKMMHQMKRNRNTFSPYSAMSSNSHHGDSKMDTMKMMMQMMKIKNMFNSMRFKRAAGDNLDLGDRLVEKLAEQKHQMEAKIGNMTCVMRELNVLDASNNIDVQ